MEAKKEAAEGKRRMAILEASKLQTYTDVSETDTPPSAGAASTISGELVGARSKRGAGTAR